MVKTVLGVNHSGLRDWLIQRVSAIVMVVYFVFLMGFFLAHPNLSFYAWRDLFTHLSMKVATMLVLLSLLFHAWVGMWTVFTDYVKPFVLRLVIQMVVFLSLIAFFFEGVFILWGI